MWEAKISSVKPTAVNKIIIGHFLFVKLYSKSKIFIEYLEPKL